MCVVGCLNVVVLCCVRCELLFDEYGSLVFCVLVIAGRWLCVVGRCLLILVVCVLPTVDRCVLFAVRGLPLVCFYACLLLCIVVAGFIVC